MNNTTTENTFVDRESFIELDARERSKAILDAGTVRELLGPFDRLESPWLAMQDVTPQADDGCVVMKGKVAGKPVVVVALEGAFQGGSMGEVSGQKMTAALDLACADSVRGKPTSVVLLLETGGVRLQEANLGLAAVAEIMASVVALRKHAPVICLTTGMVGCFGGMSLVAGLASYVILTPEARLGMNGPEVIEQESGVEEFNAADRSLIWAIHGGEQRFAMGLADALVEDNVRKIKAAVQEFVLKGLPPMHRSAQAIEYGAIVRGLNTSGQWDPVEFRGMWANEVAVSR